jgi:hypothetical protein
VSDHASLVFSLELDLLTSVGFLKTRTSPQWSPASSNSAASSFGRAACGQYPLGRSLLGLAGEGHGMTSRVQLVVFGGSGVSDSRLLKREVPVGGACGPHAAAGDGIS